jgi:ubiquinone/menaquinone biosynthesis C-methylase UbiE
MSAQLLFDIGAEFYGWLTWQPTWREHCRSLVDFFPSDLFDDGGARSLRVLDVGVGPGVSAIGILDRLPGSAVTGLDFSSRMLAVAEGYARRAGAKVEFVQADAAEMPFEDDSFDVVTGHSFLYLVPDKRAVIEEVARVLRPGGACVFLEPNRDAGPRNFVGLTGSKRFQLSMFLWRVFSRGYGRFDSKGLEQLLGTCLEHETATPTLGGLGLIGCARAPRV